MSSVLVKVVDIYLTTLQLGKYPLLVYTKTVDSVKRARWLARQTPDILCYLPPSNSRENGVWFSAVTSEEIIQINFCGVYDLTVLVYTKTTIHLSVGG